MLPLDEDFSLYFSTENPLKALFLKVLNLFIYFRVISYQFIVVAFHVYLQSKQFLDFSNGYFNIHFTESSDVEYMWHGGQVLNQIVTKYTCNAITLFPDE